LWPDGRAGALAGGKPMLKWALIFFVISLIAGGLGFSGISAATAGIAKILFFLFLALTAVVIVIALMVGQFVF
jgi:uncharacterized membrane protein YtjA (UPF0391 family)